MPSVPNRSVMRPRRCSALRVLRRLAGLLQAVLAALLLPRVAHEQPGLLEGRTQLVVEGHERARDAETQRAGLAAHAAAVERRVDVVHVGRLGEAQRLGGDDLVRERREVPLEVASVDLDDAGAGTQPDTRDRLLAPPGRLDEGLGHALPPGAARQRAGDGFLRRVRMRGPGVHAQLPHHLPAEATLGEHALDRLPHDLLRVAGEQAPEALGLDAAGVSRVPPVPLALGLARADVELGGVDDDHVITSVDVRRPGRLVLAPQQRGDLGRETTEHGAVGVDDVPRALDVGGLGAECTHRKEEVTPARGSSDNRVEAGRVQCVTAPPAAAPVHGITAEREDDAEQALEILLDAALDPIVDMVLLARDDAYEASSHDGWVRFRRTEDGGFATTGGEGASPLADQSTDRFAGLEAERAHPYPTRRENAYPYGLAQVAQLFDHPAAPDLCVIHSAAHNWEDQGGHRGEHGSLDVVQARAPFVVAGTGVRADGLVPRAGRLVDVAPTIAELFGVAPADDGTYVRGQDGEVRADVLDPAGGRPRHVVGFLWDGTNPNVLYAMAAAGQAPNIARLLEMGTAYEHGAMAGLPTVTLANHTSILTGRLPGHHGILNNAWYDRRHGRQIITNSSATWPTAMESLTRGVETIHDAVHRTWPDAFTASVNEPADPGADYSTFDFFRRAEVPPIPPTPEGPRATTERSVRPSKDYQWSTIVDHMCVEQATGIWSGNYRDVDYPKPRFMWVNFTLTDSAFHEGGPHSEIAAAAIRDCDARLGEVLAAVERAGAFDDTAFVLVADHGREENDPAVGGDWDVPLREAGLQFRDEGYSFLYLGEQ